MREWIETAGPPLVDEAVREALARDLGVEASKLRGPLRSCGLPLSPEVEGVRQDSLPELERTLHALAASYEAADAARRRAIRADVILARQHAGWAARGAPPERAAEKEEMLLWLRTWLENPPLFAAWVALRKRRQP